ncbi:MAG: phosphonate ABC transporter, permease protein PhnE [Rhodospirillaceae bacterium]|nr:phosphonate ABC transporter, permease protein PhnE [Rhodospirillaceae bacterium]
MTPAGRTWRRFAPGQRLARYVVYFVLLAAIAASLRAVEIIPEFLYDAPEQMADLLHRMWPIDFAFYPDQVHAALIETIHIATLGTIMAIGIALPVGVLAARNVTRSVWMNQAAKLVLVSSRSVNSLVWALLFIAIFGPGPLAGTFAIAFRSVGFVGKLLSEALEEAQRGPIEALTAAGASWLSRIRYGFWPHARPTFWSIAVFRWDINVRESAVLGLVGAGGVGMLLNAAIDTFQWNRVATILVSVFGLVILAEILVTLLRRRLI